MNFLTSFRSPLRLTKRELPASSNGIRFSSSQNKISHVHIKSNAFTSMLKNEKKVESFNLFRWNQTSLKNSMSMGSSVTKRFIYSKEDKVKKPELEDVAKKELLDGKTKEEIVKIWVEHHRQQDCLAGICDAKKFEEIRMRSSYCPIFVLPLMRGEGSLTMLTRSEMGPNANTKIVYFTLMHMYQEQGASAPPILTLYFYTDYAKSKDLVLMKGVYDPLKRTNVTPSELQSLVQLWQIFLLDDTKYLLMRTFNHEAEKFNYADVIKASENLSLGLDGSSLSFHQSGEHPPKVELPPSGTPKETTTPESPVMDAKNAINDEVKIEISSGDKDQIIKDAAERMAPKTYKFKEPEPVKRKTDKKK